MRFDPDFPFVIAALAIIAGTVISVSRIFVNRRPAEGVGSPELKQIEERLNRIEQAVDAIAVEAERISEAQRFTTKLLSQAPRQPPGTPPAA